jgi:hypothetical protein
MISKMLIYAVIVLLILLLVYWISQSETFISFMTTLSEYGPQPYIIMTKYVPNNKNGKIAYPDLDKFTKSLVVLEIYTNQTYKVYSDDGLVREGIVPAYLWDYVKQLDQVAPYYHQQSFCNFIGKDMTYYYIWVNGYIIDLGIFSQCIPIELYPAKKLLELMNYSEISYSTPNSIY